MKLPATYSNPAPQGLYRATVHAIAPSGAVTLSIPKLFGQGTVPDCEPAVFSPALAVGDRVFAECIENDRNTWAVICRRA